MAKAKSVTRIPGEDARMRSVRLANKRVSSLLKYVGLVGNLGGVGYQLTEDEKSKILATIGEAVAKLDNRMAGESVVKELFKL